MNNTFVIDKENSNGRSNATFVLDKPSAENSPSKTAKKDPPSPVEKLLNDRMTQSLHIENNATNGGGTTSVIRKASFNGPVDLNRVPSAPSLK